MELDAAFTGRYRQPVSKPWYLAASAPMGHESRHTLRGTLPAMSRPVRSLWPAVIYRLSHLGTALLMPLREASQIYRRAAIGPQPARYPILHIPSGTTLPSAAIPVSSSAVLANASEWSPMYRL
jgi:hypothetical protein